MLTFIIPTIGRDTLATTLDSLRAQSDKRWKAIVLFDGIPPTLESPDPRISILTCPKLGQGKNHAGRVRNIGMEKATTEWVGFVDDDDTLSPQYTQTFYQEIASYPKMDTIIFRMSQGNIILPPLSIDTFQKNYVGISFAMRRSLFQKFKMEPSATEDYDLLDRIRSGGHPMMISPYTLYFVRDAKKEIDVCGYRVLINS